MLMNSRSNVEYDGAAATILSPTASQSWSGAGRHVADAVALPAIFGSIWDDPDAPELAVGNLLVANIHVSALGGSGDVVFCLEGASSEDFSSPEYPLLAMQLTHQSVVGQIYRMAVDARSVRGMLVAANFVALSVTLTDTASVSYRSWLSVK